MIISKKYNYTQIFLKMLCPPEDYYALLQAAGAQLQYRFEHECADDRMIEHEAFIDGAIVVAQYHPHLGIHLYLNDMEDAKEQDETILNEVATKMQQLL